MRLYACLLILLVCSGARAADEPLARAQSLLAALGPDIATETYAQTARDFGAIVDEVRQSSASDGTLIAMRKVAADMRKRAQERLRAAEAAAGDDEGALESLYRSQVWEHLSFAMSAFPFWGSWLDLTLADRPAQAGNRVQLLWRAKRGFRAASMQIYQPSLVYGGWLGLGFVARAEGQDARARQIFDSLKQALAFDPKHPVRQVIDAELDRMDGRAPIAAAPAPPATPAARWAGERAQVFALLEQQRKRKVGAREAGAKLREIVDAGGMDMSLLAELLKYQAEIVSEDLREYTELIGAEFAFSNEQWFSAVQKYKAFFAQEARGADMNFDRFRYRQAVAAFKADLSTESAQLAERLLARRGLDAELRKATTKLAYLARARRIDSKSTADAKNALNLAARRFLDASPSDPDADGARVVLAQASGDTGQALKLLSGVKSSARFEGGVESLRFYVIARQFAKVANATDASVESLARQGLNAWDELPAEQKKTPENQALYLQLKSVADRDPAAVLEEIDRAERKPGLGAGSHRAYFWAKLRCWDRLGEPGRVREEIAKLGAAPVPSWMAEALYPWIKKQPDRALQAELAALLAPKLKPLPDMERRFRLLEIETLLALGRAEEAYAAARALIADYPKAGDAYRMLGRAAAATKRYVEADDAWAVITDKVPPSFEVWWEGMLSRIELRAASTRPEAACELTGKVAREAKAPTAELAQRWDALRRRLACAPAS
ncbi:MAG TPA: hypothetical protein PJ986_12015 [Gammaproteobacteria bacterium]|nr:hypothetical protein [Gammaproteobacteria bacterium]